MTGLSVERHYYHATGVSVTKHYHCVTSLTVSRICVTGLFVMRQHVTGLSVIRHGVTSLSVTWHYHSVIGLPATQYKTLCCRYICNKALSLSPNIILSG